MSAPNPECLRLFQETNWSSTPLGPQDGWTPELRTLVNVMLGSLQPMLIVWGPAQTTLYNDGYAQMCGLRHPAAFGRSFYDLWYDIWDQVDPIITAAYAGQGTSMADITFTMHRKGYPEETHFAFSYTPVRDPWGKVLGMFCACTETTTEVKLRREELNQRERFIQVFELSPGGIAMLVGPYHVFEYANDSYYSMVGLCRDIIGKPVADALKEVVDQGIIELLDGVFRTGEPYIARGMSIALNRGPEGETQRRFIDLVYQPMRDIHGTVIGILVQAQDVTEERAEARHRELLSHELGHRLKNQLAMLQAIASQTLRNATDLHSARTDLMQRIAVLGRAHDALIAGGRGSSTVGELVAQLLAINDDPVSSRFIVSGPPLVIGPRAALSLSLILHELGTNALKYGALSVPQGRVSIHWAVTENGKGFRLTWEETGGPVVQEPASRGSGTRLIQAGLAGTEHCEISLDYHETGLHFQVDADLSGVQQSH